MADNVKVKAKDQLHISAMRADSFRPGGEFEVSEAMAADLEKRGLVSRSGGGRKAAEAPQNKAEAAPDNKAEPRPLNKDAFQPDAQSQADKEPMMGDDPQNLEHKTSGLRGRNQPADKDAAKRGRKARK